VELFTQILMTLCLLSKMSTIVIKIVGELL
jgi:hypothetical protein